MEPPSIFQLISTTAVLIGIAFGIINISLFRASRKREAAIVMLNSFQTSEFLRGLFQVFSLPEGAGQADLDKLPMEQFLAVYVVMGTWERLGILVFRREIPLALVQDAFSGPIIQSWQKLEKYVGEFREWMNRTSAMEWFQWLAERMLELEKDGEPEPAYILHRNWKP